MNLNFYNPNMNNNLENLQNTLQDQIAKLDQLKNISLNRNAQVQSPLQEQRYYLDCGKKEDWDEFLKINYGITETQIFDDYRLFLQAKIEINESQDKEKLELMKQKIKPSNVKKEINDTNTTNQSSLAINKHKLEQNTNNNENKGAKYVR